MTAMWRWLLAPISQWRSHRLVMHHGPSLNYETAWSLVLLAQDPASLPYVRRSWLQSERERSHVGVMVDVWVQITEAERRRRLKWLQRHSETPLYRLGITEELIELAGLSVTEWSLPPNCPAASIVVQQRGRRSD